MIRLRWVRPWVSAAAAVALGLGAASSPTAQGQPQTATPPPVQTSPRAVVSTDLDVLMARALAHRDENWKKLRQYVLDERENIEVRGPNDLLLYGDHREYTWYIRDGLFLRSPVKANGISVPEEDRRKYEQQWLNSEKRREKSSEKQKGTTSAERAEPEERVADDLSGLLRQSREPRFISAGYFMDFKFEPGNYYLAGRETMNGKEVLRVEYYPTKLFSGEKKKRDDSEPTPKTDEEALLMKKMNRTALVTLWVEPASAEIRRYTFDNLGLGFLPGAWLLRITELKADVSMAEPFEGILLPGTVNVRMAVALANGTYRANFGLEYHDYKQAKVRSTMQPVR